MFFRGRFSLRKDHPYTAKPIPAQEHSGGRSLRSAPTNGGNVSERKWRLLPCAQARSVTPRPSNASHGLAGNGIRPTGPICSEIPTDPLVAEKAEFHYSVCRLRGSSNRHCPHKRASNLSRKLGTEEGF